MILILKDSIIKSLFVLFGILCFSKCVGQGKTKVLKYSQVGWTISVPTNSDVVSSKQLDSLLNEITNKSAIELNLSKPKILFLIRKDAYNFFGSSISTFDTTNFKTLEQAYGYAKKSVIDIIKANESDISLLDSASSTESIDGSIFQRLYLKTGYPKQNVILDQYWFYRNKGNLDLSINIAFSNKDIGNEYLRLLRASKFEQINCLQQAVTARLADEYIFFIRILLSFSTSKTS